MEPSAPSGECADGSRDCPVVYVDALALSRPGGLVAAAAEAFRARPGAALLKLVPTGDWRPPDASPQAVDDLRIPVPVRQHAHGARGCYTLSLEELVRAAAPRPSARRDPRRRVGGSPTPWR